MNEIDGMLKYCASLAGERNWFSFQTLGDEPHPLITALIQRGLLSPYRLFRAQPEYRSGGYRMDYLITETGFNRLEEMAREDAS